MTRLSGMARPPRKTAPEANSPRKKLEIWQKSGSDHYFPADHCIRAYQSNNYHNDLLRNLQKEDQHPETMKYIETIPIYSLSPYPCTADNFTESSQGHLNLYLTY